jgi:hypothetical protein
MEQSGKKEMKEERKKEEKEKQQHYKLPIQQSQPLFLN